ncbi:3-oxoacyl-ACP reductase [Cupriavidus sp. SK-4]|uniref:hypothetical protein n=1 Tax=Cupriavidus sp. SK-4 TaxID=574750 RepID=UPI00044ECC80|nr:hypothetical protein [Cupriavidus sp. SK-4]EYS97613.1 3-oxoacyl-ACP reductase [Cupriavidus sp. SK-4]
MHIAYDFKEQSALVTGTASASGIGLGTARAFAEAGAAVTLADVSAAALQEYATRGIRNGQALAADGGLTVY